MSKNKDLHPDATTIARPRLDSSTLSVSAFELQVVEGPQGGQSFSIDANSPSRVMLGKSPICEMRLDDPAVSRRHASLEVIGKKLRIRDQSSTNGTFVDGTEIAEAFLIGGETIRLGSSAIAVVRTQARAVPANEATAFGRVIGQSQAMRKLYPLCERLAQATVPVVLEGETGTGKEQLAESLHQTGPRRGGPFVVFDCTAVAPNLIESELFGHEKGAFTGSVASRKGVFERADGGTLLIDEIGDMPLELQAKLLRAIERAEIQRVGGDTTIRVNVRVLAATRRDLDREVALGRFRDDLFHRLAVARIELPPLRERGGDIRLLCRHFCRELGADPGVLDETLLSRWEDSSWPGNVRELRNAVARRLALGDLADELAQQMGASAPAVASRGDTIARVLSMSLPLGEARDRIVAEFEQRYVQNILEQHDGNVSRAAAAAGVARRHLHRLKSRHLPGDSEDQD